MNLKQAVKKYGRRFPVVAEYEDYDRYIYINESDPDLQKWRVPIPEPPDWDKIDGFGLKPKDQFFKLEEYPSRLKLLEDNIRRECQKNRLKKDTDFTVERNTYTKLWGALENKPRDYKEELDWIKTQWYHRNYGKWYFIFGKPIYISKWHWFYLNYWKMEDLGLPDFRIRDQKWFLAQEYCSVTTETVVYNESTVSGKTIKEPIILEDGTLKLRDIKARTCYGSNNLKGRRVGETSKAQDINYCIGTDKIDANCGIQGNTENTAEDVYNEKLLYAFNRMAFFFVPEMPNFYTTSGLHFSGVHGKGGLNSKIVYATTAKKEFFDQKRLDFIHTDEVGKTRLENVEDRHGVVKRCCSAGDIIKGFMIYTSTSEDMEADAGMLFEKLTMASMFENRLSNGQTKSGLINVYFPMYEAYEGFIDQYGYAIIDTPRDDQIPYMNRVEKGDDGEIMGAKAYIEKIEQDLSDSGDLNALAQFQRQHPSTFRKCFALASRGNKFNAKILQETMMELKFNHEDIIRTGNFEWVGIPFRSKIKWIDNNDGPFKVSWQPVAGRESRIVNSGGVNMPGFDDGIVMSADPYRFDQVDGTRESLGGIAAFRMFDERVDGEKTDPTDYITNNFVCTYLFRERSVDEFSHAVLRAAIFFNALVYPEKDGSIQKFFIDKGYGGYLFFDIDPETGVKKKNAGFSAAGPSIKPKLFSLVDTYINLHGRKCKHLDILNEYLTIKDFNDMKNKDLFVASAGCLLAARNRYADVVKRFSDIARDGVDVTGWWI